MTGAVAAPALFKEGNLLSSGRNIRCHGDRRNSPGGKIFPLPVPDPYVPISHEARYFLCSGVNVSILAPIAASLRLAISRSIASGIG